jgi:quinol-cytochrome oxidoreductase complex cytochrome b subunit
MDSVKEFFSGNITKKSILGLILTFSVVSSIFATMCNANCNDSKDRSKTFIHASYVWIILCAFLFAMIPKIGDSDGLFNVVLVISICVGILSSSFALECSVGCKDPEHKNNPKTNETTYGIAGFTLAFSIVFGLLVCWATMT